MKNALLAVVVVTILILSALSAFASWDYQWSTDFTGLTPGSLTGQDGWIAPVYGSTTNLGCTVVNAGGEERYVNAGPTGVQQSAADYRDLRYLNPDNSAYYQGHADFWMYDPRGTGTALQTDARVGVYSDAYQGISSTNFVDCNFGINLGDGRTNGKNYWVAYVPGGYMAADGSGSTMSSGGGGGFTITSMAGQARQRSIGWHQIRISWNFTTTTGRYDMYVDNMISPCVTATIESRNSRWANVQNVAGVWIGSTGGANSLAARIDDISFYGNVPEPSSFMALGAGMIGLLGLIRRQK